jgi:hypothetical protein
MAEQRALAARQHRCHRPRDRLHPDVANRVDPGVDADEIAARQTLGDRPTAQTQVEQLSAGDVPVLLGGNAGNKARKSCFIAHTP